MRTATTLNKWHIVALAVISVVVGATVWYYDAAERTRMQGFVFGTELEGIQDDIKALQTQFAASIITWEEGDIDQTELMAQLQEHINKFEDVIERYDTLTPPAGFEGAVELFKLSSYAQLQSDREYINWLSTGDEASKIRSDLQIQESFQLEIAALSEYNTARGIMPAP